MRIWRISLQPELRAYRKGLNPSPEALEAKLEELPSEDLKEPKREADKILVQKMHSSSPEDRVNRLIFGCKVLLLSGLFPARRKWLQEELRRSRPYPDLVGDPR
ncbi:hypothetical protein ACHAPJ_007014 [Fusarium lateritium]